MRKFLLTLSAAAALILTAFTPPASAVAGPVIVGLGMKFSPASVVLSPGEPLLVTVSGEVMAAVTDPAPGRSIAGGALGSSTYLYYAIKPGTTTLSAIVGPHCAVRVVCPQWRTAPRLNVTVVSGSPPRKSASKSATSA